MTTTPAPSEKPSEEAMRLAVEVAGHRLYCVHYDDPPQDGCSFHVATAALAIDSAITAAVQAERERVLALLELLYIGPRDGCNTAEEDARDRGIYDAIQAIRVTPPPKECE